MFGELNGLVSEIESDHIILNIGGVGYVVYLAPRLIQENCLVGSSMRLLIETKFKVDKIVLFGFLNKFQKFCFGEVAAVSGVSDKIAQIISATFNPRELLNLVHTKEALPMKIPGMGQKTVEKILFALRSNKNFAVNCSQFESLDCIGSSNISLTRDGVEALIGLGIGRNSAVDLISKVLKEDGNIDLGTLIKRALASYK